MPSLVASPLLMSAFFMVVYDGQFSPMAELLSPGVRYIDTVLPLCLITTAFTGGAVAGQLLVRDIESGYYARILITPVSRGVSIGAPIAAGTVVLAFQAVVLVCIGYLLGLRPAGGPPAALALVGATVVIGLGFLLLAAAAAVWAGTASAVSSVTLIFFPLSLLTAALVPRERLGGWMATAADINPLTYLLDGTRALLVPGTDLGDLAGAGTTSAILVVVGVLAVWLAAARRKKIGV